MFKAVHLPEGEEIIILHPKWMGRISELRALDAEDALICQGCRQPVRVHAGEIRRPYYAHKHLANCSYRRESPALLQARAILYQRLVQDYGDAVTVEKQVDQTGIPRPVDCWVERPSGVIAYWIVDAGMRARSRADLIEGFEQLGIRVIWVLTSNLLRADEAGYESAHFTTTERDLMCPSTFDVEIRNFRFVAGKSLHYLDTLAETLTTFRSLELVHPPNVYKGRREDHLLSEVTIARKTGEFVHPGEREHWEAVQVEKKRLKQLETENQERQARFEQRRLEDQVRRALGGDALPIVSSRSRSTNFQNLINSPDNRGDHSDESIRPSERIFTCEHCGEEKPESEFWEHWGTKGKCYACSRKGLW